MPDTPASAPVTLTINGVTVLAPKGTMLVDAAKAYGIEIPIFCYEPRLGSPIGACRMCLVEVEGLRGLQTACSTPVAPDMVVRTTTDEVRGAHDGVLELLLANHPLDCPVCDKGGECPLQDRTFRFGPGRTRFSEAKRHFPKPLDLSPLVALDRERCIACFRCIRFSQDVAQDGQLTFQERGGLTEVATFSGDPYEGRFTGNIIDLCPVGALTSIPYRFVSRPWDISNAPSVCPHCPVGCNVELTGREGELKRVTGRPDPNMAVEEGWLCDKGRWAYAQLWSEDRISECVLGDRLGRRRVPPERAVAAMAGALQRHGAAPAVLVGPDATVEEGKLALDVARILGAPIARLGLPDAGLGDLRALPRADLADLDRADVVAVVGGDPSNQQPVVELRIRKARRLGARIVSIGPRPHVVAGLGEAVATAPGALSGGLAALARALQGTGRAIVLWDAADLAADTAAAAALARVVRAAGARQIELGADVNGAGLRALGIPTRGVLEALEEGRVDTLLIVRAEPLAAAGSTRWHAALAGARTILEMTTHRTALTERAEVVMPLLAHQEQEGVLVSMDGRVQRLRPAARGPVGAAAGWEALVGLTHRLGAPVSDRTPAHVMARAAADHAPLAGLTYEALGVLGAPLAAPPDPVPAAPQAPQGEGLALVGTRPIFGDRASHRSDALRAVRSAGGVALAPAEAGRLGLGDGAAVELTSSHGACVLSLTVDPALPEGAAFVTLGVPGSGVERLLAPDAGPVRVRLSAHVPAPAEEVVA